MKFFLAFTLIVTVASGSVIKPSPDRSIVSVVQQILDALGNLRPEVAAPIAVEPEIVESESPAIVDSPVVPSPVIITPGPVADVEASKPPLVQIILNINQAVAESSPVIAAPVVIPETIQPSPVHVVETAPEPVQVIETAPIAINPIGVVEIAPEPVQVIEAAPVPVEPVIIGTPIIPAPAVVLPEELN